METQFLFPLPLFKFEYPRANKLQTSIVNRIKKIEEEDTVDISQRYSPGSYTTFYSKTELFKEPCLQDLAKFVHSAVTTVHTHTGLSGELNFTQSWANINRKYSYHEQHHHCPNIWSGVYYVQAQDNDATICFMNSNILDSSWPYKATKVYHNDLNSSQTVCRVHTGMLLIFPSYLPHKVSQQLADTERVSIAFNMDVQ